MADQLSDPFLVAHVGKNVKKLKFLSEPTRQILRELIAKAKTKENKGKADFLSTRDNLDKLWRELMVDAIHALKVRDRREKAHQRQFPVEDEKRNSQARDQNVYGIAELKRYFDSFNDFERVLYGSESTYRDHITHVIRIWLIGVYLLTRPDQIAALDVAVDVKGLDSKVKENAAQISDQERWAMWTVVALCHDLGYPLEKTHQINDVIDAMLGQFGNIALSRYRYSFQPHHQPLNEIMLRIVSSKVRQSEPPTGDDEEAASQSGEYRTPIQPKYYTKFAHSLEEFRHGVISCLVLMKTLVYFMETDYRMNGQTIVLEDARQFHIRREILRAIASHTCPDVYHLQTNTLSFLLILCDELQEWGRPTFRDMKLGNVGSGEDGEVAVAECDLANGVFEASVDYPGKNPSDAFAKGKFRLFHKLLRAAIDDQLRQIKKFRWEVRTAGVSYVLEYESGRGPFEELSYTVGGKDKTADLWDES